jgi:hypothetical protein
VAKSLINLLKSSKRARPTPESVSDIPKRYLGTRTGDVPWSKLNDTGGGLPVASNSQLSDGCVRL